MVRVESQPNAATALAWAPDMSALRPIVRRNAMTGIGRVRSEHSRSTVAISVAAFETAGLWRLGGHDSSIRHTHRSCRTAQAHQRGDLLRNSRAMRRYVRDKPDLGESQIRRANLVPVRLNEVLGCEQPCVAQIEREDHRAPVCWSNT